MGLRIVHLLLAAACAALAPSPAIHSAHQKKQHCECRASCTACRQHLERSSKTQGIRTTVRGNGDGDQAGTADHPHKTYQVVVHWLCVRHLIFVCRVLGKQEALARETRIPLNS